MTESSINQSPLEYWRHTTYTPEDVDAVCRKVDDREMATRISFDGEGNVAVTVTERTWSRRGGHYPSVVDYFREVARHPAVLGKKGSLIVWLEDGLWPWNQPLSKRAPILSFGRQNTDHHTFLIPDPAYFGSQGYEDELAELRVWSRDYPWSHRKPAAFWRGTSTGLGIEGEAWISTARGRLTLLAKKINNTEILDAKFSSLNNLAIPQREIISGQGLLGEQMPFVDFLHYRYLLDADGYSCAWRSLFLKLGTGSATLKIQSDYEQWYFRKLIPWKNVIPIASDLADFEETFQWLNTHDSAAYEIAKAGEELISSLKYEESLEETAILCRDILNCCKITEPS